MTDALAGSVTLLDVLSIVSQRRVPLAPELAGYLALEIAEQCAADDSLVDASTVYVSEEGSVAVVRAKKGETSGSTEASIRALLGKLLEASGSQTPALAAAARKKPGAGVGSVTEDIEAALIPVNRAAGRRALARLAREVKRVLLGVGRNASVPPPARPPSERPPPPASTFEEEENPTTARREIPAEVLADAVNSKKAPDAPVSLSDLPTVGLTREDLDHAKSQAKRDSVDSLLDNFEVSDKREDKALSRELKEMVGLDPTPPPPGAMTAEDEGLDALLADEPAAKAASSVRTQTKPEGKLPKARAKQVSYADDRQLPTSPSQVKRATASITSEHLRPKKRGSAPLVIALVLAALVAVGLWQLKPGFLTGRTPEKIQQEKDEAERERQRIAALNAIPQCRTSLVVSNAPDDSEILLRAGQAPVDIEHMPVGVRLEFVATADGFAPKRVVIPQGTAWDTGAGGKPRFELGIQLDKSKAKPGQVDPWPPGEPGSEVGGKGNGVPGTVHAISTPKGAELWLLAGLGPSATVDDLAACDTDVDVLAAGPKTYRKRVHVAAAQFQPDAARPGWRVAKVALDDAKAPK